MATILSIIRTILFFVSIIILNKTVVNGFIIIFTLLLKNASLQKIDTYQTLEIIPLTVKSPRQALSESEYNYMAIDFHIEKDLSHNDYPDVLETTIITENNEAITMRWKETESFLVNENLPVWTATSMYHLHEDREVMNRIGKMRMYHDLEKSSAVVLVEIWNCIFGIIDVRYTIICLPLDLLFRYQHKIGVSPHVTALNNNGIIHHESASNIWRPFETARGTSSFRQDSNDFRMLVKTWSKPQRSSVCHAIHSGTDDKGNYPSTSHGVPRSEDFQSHEDLEDEVIITYPEILVLVPYDIASYPHHLDTLVLQYIVQLNAVAMLFAKLATHNIKIHINMAGMIIDRGYGFFPPGELFAYDPPEGQFVLRSIIDYMNRLQDPREHRRKLFFDDSFDMFIYSTTKEWQEKVFDTRGISTRVFDLLSVRNIYTRLLERKFLGSIVNYSNILQHYVNIAREIAHLMTVQDDPMDVPTCGNAGYCHAIMKKHGQYCPHCLTWSPESIHSFKRFLSVNTNRCFLRNLPRSLHPIDEPVKSFIPADQCLCYGYTPSDEATHLGAQSQVACKKKLRCFPDYMMTGNNHQVYPIDGTPCDKNNDRKVCWKRHCIPMRSRDN